MARLEIYGTRDARFSAMHRLFDRDFYMFDSDYYLVNSECKPICFIEEKHKNVKEVDLQSLQIKSAKMIADAMQAPFFVMVTTPKGTEPDAGDTWGFFVIPVNQHANEALIKFRSSKAPVLLSQRKLYELECSIRNRPVDEQISINLSDDKPKVFFRPEIAY